MSFDNNAPNSDEEIVAPESFDFGGSDQRVRGEVYLRLNPAAVDAASAINGEPRCTTRPTPRWHRRVPSRKERAR